MHIRFTYHAQIRFYERNFSIEQMKDTIINPDYTRISQDGKIVSRKKFINGEIEVVYLQRGNKYIIITVYFP